MSIQCLWLLSLCYYVAVSGPGFGSVVLLCISLYYLKKRQFLYFGFFLPGLCKCVCSRVKI